MHGVAATIGMPGEILGVLQLSVALRKQAPWATLPLGALAVAIWLWRGALRSSPHGKWPKGGGPA
jgi:hypothetical protein